MPAARCSGATAIIRPIVVQFGFAMIPLWSRAAASLTPTTTSGTDGSIRNAEELSTTTAPASANAGANSREREPPAENSATSIPDGSAVARSSITTPPHLVVTVLPAERLLAMRRNSDTGKSLSSRIEIIALPTAPVAPTTAVLVISGLLQKCRVQGANSFFDLRLSYDARNADTRCRDHFDVHFVLSEHLEHSGGNPRVGTHACLLYTSPSPRDR